MSKFPTDKSCHFRLYTSFESDRNPIKTDRFLSVLVKDLAPGNRSEFCLHAIIRHKEKPYWIPGEDFNWILTEYEPFLKLYDRIRHHIFDLGSLLLTIFAMIYVFIFRSDVEQAKGLHSMQIDVQLSGKIVGALPPSAAYYSTKKTEILYPDALHFVAEKCRCLVKETSFLVSGIF